MADQPTEGKFARRNREYRAFLQKHPGKTFAEFMAAGTVRDIKNGKPHATLGPNLLRKTGWPGVASQVEFRTIQDTFDIISSSRVLDYGCGTLRVGVHFIEHLNPGCYFGLDVDKDLLAIGVKLAGAKLMKQKRARTGVIFDKATMKAAEQFDADFVYSGSVATHVHPAEADTYFANLSRLTHPGATLVFGVAIGDNPVPDRHLVWPMERYIAALPGLEFVRFHKSDAKNEHGGVVTLGNLEFRNPGKRRHPVGSKGPMRFNGPWKLETGEDFLTVTDYSGERIASEAVFADAEIEAKFRAIARLPEIIVFLEELANNRDVNIATRVRTLLAGITRLPTN